MSHVRQDRERRRISLSRRASFSNTSPASRAARSIKKCHPETRKQGDSLHHLAWTTRPRKNIKVMASPIERAIQKPFARYRPRNFILQTGPKAVRQAISGSHPGHRRRNRSGVTPDSRPRDRAIGDRRSGDHRADHRSAKRPFSIGLVRAAKSKANFRSWPAYFGGRAGRSPSGRKSETIVIMLRKSFRDCESIPFPLCSGFWMRCSIHPETAAG